MIGYLKPKIHNQQHPNFYIKSGSQGNIVRNIYEGVEYDDYENQLIEELSQLIDFDLHHTWKKSDYLKMIVCGYELQLRKCVRNHVKFLHWYDTYEPNKDNLNSGEFYIFGYDKQLRPVIVIKNITHENLNDFLYLLETIKRQVLIPYYVETWSIILDLRYQMAYEIKIDVDIQVFLLQFCGNLNAIYVINGDVTFQQVISVIPNENQVHQKIKIIKNNDDLILFISRDQLEEKYGGECNNQTQFWQEYYVNLGPPVVPQVNEYLKYITIDSIDEGNRKILEFGQRTLVKFNSMGRKKSIDVKKSMNSCTSSLKIQVHEENGNALLEEEIQLDSDSESEESIKHEIETKLEREERALNTSCCSQSKCSIM